MKLNTEGLYNFHYRPVGLGKINQYDRNPLIFILDIQGGIVLGVNLHWIPKAQRNNFVLEVEYIMGKTKTVGKKRERQRLLYTLLKKPLFRAGMQAVRKYYLNHMSALREIPRNSWKNLAAIKGIESDIRHKENSYKK